MVAMLDGTQAEHGSQILSALGGYAIGLLTALVAFLSGRVIAKRMRSRYNKSNENNNENTVAGIPPAKTFDEHDEHNCSDEEDENDEEQQQDQPHGLEEDHSQSNHSGLFSYPSDESERADNAIPKRNDVENNINNNATTTTTTEPSSPYEGLDGHDTDGDDVSPPFHYEDDSSSLIHLGGSILWFGTLFVTVTLFLGFVYGDVGGNYMFYRRMWMICICTPFGAITRHQLKQWLPKRRSIYWGTWTANMAGAIVSVLIQALTVRYLSGDDDDDDSWLRTVLWALQVGFAGSLSTVSTFVKELVDLESLRDRHLYGIVTLLVAMFLGLAIYSPIVRS
jgi:fluoride ion exporter CrcB/FEX